MRKTLLAACLLSSFAATAGAQSSEASYSPKGLRPFLGIGLAAGGDTLLRVQDTVEGSSTGKQSNIRAGDGLDLRLGLSMRLGDLPLSLQTVVAYHNDQTNGIDETKYRFRRVPVEATLLWHATDRARIGFGLRKSTNPVVKIDNGLYQGLSTRINAKIDMKASTGFIALRVRDLPPQGPRRPCQHFPGQRRRQGQGRPRRHPERLVRELSCADPS